VAPTPYCGRNMLAPRIGNEGICATHRGISNSEPPFRLKTAVSVPLKIRYANHRSVMENLCPRAGGAPTIAPAMLICSHCHVVDVGKRV
jgi:hypothetical protein